MPERRWRRNTVPVQGLVALDLPDAAKRQIGVAIRHQSALFPDKPHTRIREMCLNCELNRFDILHSWENRVGAIFVTHVANTAGHHSRIARSSCLNNRMQCKHLHSICEVLLHG